MSERRQDERIVAGAGAESAPGALLWIDDEITIDDASVLLLKHGAYEIECANTGRQGLAKALAGAFDGIILDLRLPDISGLQVLRKLTEAQKRAPVLILTGYPDIVDSTSALRFGAATFRCKPILGDDLLRAVSELMALACAPPSRRASTDASAARARDRPMLVELIAFLDFLSERAGTLRAPHAPEDRYSGPTLEELTACFVSMLIRSLASRPSPPSFMACVRAFRCALNEPTIAGAGEWIARARDVLTASTHLPAAHSALVQTAIELSTCSGRRYKLGSITGRLAVDGRHLRAVFAQETGLTLRDWSTAYYMADIVAALICTDEQIAQIAYSIGYEHPSQLDRDFLRLLGLSPRAFRRLWRASCQ